MRVVVVSDRGLVRAGYVALLDSMEGVSGTRAAEDAAAAVSAVRATPADVFLAAAAGRDAVALVQALREHMHPVPVLLVTNDASPAFVRAVFAAGAGGVVTTTASVGELASALATVRGGSSYLHPSLGATLAQVDAHSVVDDLSRREREVLRLIGRGLTNAEIARELVVSIRTVETHRAHLVRKLGARSRAELVRHAMEGGLLEDELPA